MKRKIESVMDLLTLIYETVEKKELPIAKLEEKAGLSTGMISRWKNSKEGPHLSRIIELLEILDVELYAESSYDGEKKESHRDKKLLPSSPISILQMGLIDTINSYLQNNEDAKKEFNKIIKIVTEDNFDYNEFLCAFLLFLFKIEKGP